MQKETNAILREVVNEIVRMKWYGHVRRINVVVEGEEVDG